MPTMVIEEIRFECRVNKAERAALETACKKGKSPIPLPDGYRFTKIDECGHAPDERLVYVFFQRVDQTDEKGNPI
jgi:hypothetical protein